MQGRFAVLIWIAVGVLGAAAFGVIALSRGESISAAWLVVAGVCSYLIAYRFYSRYLAYTVFGSDYCRATPAEGLKTAMIFSPRTSGSLRASFLRHLGSRTVSRPDTRRAVRFSAGYDLAHRWRRARRVPFRTSSFCAASLRRDGKSLGQMAREEVNCRRSGRAARRLRDHDHSAGGSCPGRCQRVAGQSLGNYSPLRRQSPLRFSWALYPILGPGKVAEATIIGSFCWSGLDFRGPMGGTPDICAGCSHGRAPTGVGRRHLRIPRTVLPVWLLLAPRDYFAAFVKMGAISYWRRHIC